MISLFSSSPGDKQCLAKTDGSTTAGSRSQWVVSQTNRYDGDLYSLPQGHLGQTSQSRLQNDWFVVAIDPSLGKDNKLLIVGQQIKRVSERCERGFVLINRKTSKAMKKPALEACHFSACHHEPTVASGDATSCRHRQHQGIPSGSVSGRQKDWTRHWEMLASEHQAFPKVSR